MNMVTDHRMISCQLLTTKGSEAYLGAVWFMADVRLANNWHASAPMATDWFTTLKLASQP